MEGILLIFELIEIIFELFFSGWDLFEKVSENDKLRSILKIIIYSIIGIGIIVLLSISIVYGKNLLIIITLSYSLFVIGANFLLSYLKNKKNNPFESPLRWLLRILRYTFGIALIILANMYLVDQTAKVWLIVGASVGLGMYLLIDIYRLYRLGKNSGSIIRNNN